MVVLAFGSPSAHTDTNFLWNLDSFESNIVEHFVTSDAHVTLVVFNVELDLYLQTLQQFYIPS